MIGWREAQSDPNAWVKDYLLPALDKLGIKDRENVLREVSTLFQNQMAAQMVGLLATQQAKIEKDTALWAGAPGLSAADRAMREDPGLAFEALKNSAETLVGTFGELVGAGRGFAGWMTSTAEALASFNRDLELRIHADDTPALAREWAKHKQDQRDEEFKAEAKVASDQADELQKQIDAEEARGKAWERAAINRARPELTDAQVEALVPNIFARHNAILSQLRSEQDVFNQAARQVREDWRREHLKAPEMQGPLKPGRKFPELYGPGMPPSREEETRVFGAMPVRTTRVRPTGELIQPGLSAVDEATLEEARERSRALALSHRPGPSMEEARERSRALGLSHRPGPPMELPGARPPQAIGQTIAPYILTPPAPPVSFTGQARVEQSFNVEITLDPEIRARLDMLKNFDFNVPLDALTGRQDADAAPKRSRLGGIGSM